MSRQCRNWQIFVLNFSVEEAYGPFIGDFAHHTIANNPDLVLILGMDPPFVTFRDAAFCINTYPITVLDCARAMHRAVINNHFNFSDFSLSTFRRLAKLENGDISWIIPGKFIAFSGPVTK